MELLVATTLLTIVMTAVYTAFGNTIRQWRIAEKDKNLYQDGRVAMSILKREMNCIMGGSEHLFEGEDDEVTFIAVTQPMCLEDSDGTRLLQIKYRRNGKEFVREEAEVKKPLPPPPAEGEEVEEGADVGDGKTFKLLHTAKKLQFTYYWLPPEENPEDPPVPMDPVEIDRNQRGWGLPQGVKVSLTLQDKDDEDAEPMTFTEFIVFRGPTTPYDEKRILGEGSSL